MRRVSVWAFVVCVAICSLHPIALGKKNKKNTSARLKSLQTIYVEGSLTAASYIRKNLSVETCLTNTPQASEADAILDVREDLPGPCRDGAPGYCAGISAQLLDAKTDETLWFTEDDNIPARDILHPMNGPYQWVLWGLNRACCKGRPLTTPPKNPKD